MSFASYYWVVTGCILLNLGVNFARVNLASDEILMGHAKYKVMPPQGLAVPLWQANNNLDVEHRL